MKLSYIREATTKWSGPLYNYIGNGQDWTVNYGTSDKSRPPLLYIKSSMQLLKSAARDVSNNLIVFADPQGNGNYVRIGKQNKDTIQRVTSGLRNRGYEVHANPKITHVGEAHITISMGDQLQDALNAVADEAEIPGHGIERNVRALQSVQVNGRPLFDSAGNGQRTNVTIDKERPYKILRAKFYSDEEDVHGPMLVALNVETDLYYDVREALGMPRSFTLPGGQVWKQHITVGYLPQKNIIHQSFVQMFGKQPRRTRR